MKKQKPIFLFSGLIISIAMLSSITVGGMNINTDSFNNLYHKVANFIVAKENILKDWFGGKFGASADERRIQEPNLDKIPFDIKSFNEDVEPYILFQKEENKGKIIIIPGKSNWDKQEEARLAEEARKKEEEERKRNRFRWQTQEGFVVTRVLVISK